jgi:hypothetical protein
MQLSLDMVEFARLNSWSAKSLKSSFITMILIYFDIRASIMYMLACLLLVLINEQYDAYVIPTLLAII